MAVTLMLIVLGMWNLTGVFEQIRTIRSSGSGSSGGRWSGGALEFHGQLDCHDDYVHSHPSGSRSGQHRHGDDKTPVAWLDRRFTGLGLYQIFRPLFIGLVHGPAGSAAVALLVLALIQNPWCAMADPALFGIGTITGMMMITATIGGLLAHASRRSSRVERPLRIASRPPEPRLRAVPRMLRRSAEIRTHIKARRQLISALLRRLPVPQTTDACLDRDRRWPDHRPACGMIK
jgi:high-affinity nickel-transport protein